MIRKADQIFEKAGLGGKGQSRRRRVSKHLSPAKKAPENAGHVTGGSEIWIPFASYCTTGQFMKLEDGFTRHCSPTAMVNIVRSMQSRAANGRKLKTKSEDMFLQFAKIGRRMHAYWNKDLLGRFGGTSNFMTAFYLRRCLRAVGMEKDVSVHFHPWITESGVERALEQGAIVLLEVYLHPRYKNHHMLCYACREGEDGQREYLLADGWTPGPLWVDRKGLGVGHFLEVLPRR